jgi:TP901-1 family phage major tail protein
MAAQKGRAVLVKRGSSPATLLGCRSKSITINGEPIDTTTDDDDGIRALMADAGVVTVEITVSGRVDDAVLRTEAANVDGRTKTTEFVYGAVEKFAGSFFLASYSESGESADALQFEATFQSAGEVTYTPAA